MLRVEDTSHRSMVRVLAQRSVNLMQFQCMSVTARYDWISPCFAQLCTVADISYGVAAIRQAIAKGLVAFYQKCESLLYRKLCLGVAGPAALRMCACIICSSVVCKGWLLLVHISVVAKAQPETTDHSTTCMSFDLELLQHHVAHMSTFSFRSCLSLNMHTCLRHLCGVLQQS